MESYTMYEQETSITYNREEDTATVYTASPVDIRKLDKLYSQRSNDMKLEPSTDLSRTYSIPKKWIKIVPSRILTEEQKEKCRQQMAKNLNR